MTGIYFLNGSAPARARAVQPSARGELEITTLLESYLNDGSLLDAGNFVRTLSERQGQQIGSPDEIGYYQGWIDTEQLRARAKLFGKNQYGQQLMGRAE